jgi:hypothetical protein
MADWDKGKVHCLVTWMTMVDLGQTKKGFDGAGPTKMTSLAFWTPNDSASLRKAKARTIAIQADNLFRRYWGAKYEQGKSRTTAINAAVRTLTDKDKTLADLSEVNDENYLYDGE